MFVSCAVSIAVRPVIITPPDDVTVKEGDRVMLTCGHNGTQFPWSYIKWFKNGRALPDMVRITLFSIIFGILVSITHSVTRGAS